MTTSLQATALSPQLLEAFAQTHYRVYRDAGRLAEGFTLRIDSSSGELAALMAKLGADSATYITAWNPRSTTHGKAENAQRQAQLLADLAQWPCPVFAGAGTHPDGQWPPEESLLVLGLTLQQAIELANRHGQDAVLWASADAVPRLLLLR